MRKRFSLIQAVTSLLVFIFIFVLPLLMHSRGLFAYEKSMTSQTKTAFVKVIAPISQKLAHAYGVRPSIIIAQASFESDFGRTLLARRYNNLFNSQVTSERHAIWLRNTKGQLVCYARYKSYQESISAYLMQLKAGQIGSSKSYEAFVATKNVDTLAEFLQHSGFSKSKDYARKIKAIIKVYRLKAYDK